MVDRILLYGATGYMGRLIAELAKNEAQPLVLAARDKEKLAELARDLKLPYRCFALETPSTRAGRRQHDGTRVGPNRSIDAALSGIGVVLNAAGPFGETADTLVKACLRTKTQYLDISGEYGVFGALDALDYLARERGVGMRPGVGLTSLASDLLAGMALVAAKEAQFEAPHVVRVALSRLPTVSRGSARTMLDSVRDGVLVRKGGKLVVSPIGQLVRACEFGTEQDFELTESRLCTALTLGDGFTVSRTVNRIWNALGGTDTARVPNVETYVEASAIERLSYELAGSAALALRSRPLKRYLDGLLNMWPEGPRANEREGTSQQVSVEIEDRYRRSVRARLSTINSYDFTAVAALAIAKAMLVQHVKPFGLLSPAFGLENPAEFLQKTCKLKVTFQGLILADKSAPESLDMTSWEKKYAATYSKVA